MSKSTHPALTGRPVCQVEPFPIHEAWPFHLGNHFLVVFSEPTQGKGCRMWAEWHHVSEDPEGFILARLDYEVAGDVNRLMNAVAPIFECYLRERDRDMARDLMHSASLLCYLLQQHQTPQAHEAFENQWLGYETMLMSKGDKS